MIQVSKDKLREVLTILELGGNGRYWEMIDTLRSMLEQKPSGLTPVTDERKAQNQEWVRKVKLSYPDTLDEMSTLRPINCGTNICSCIECVVPKDQQPDGGEFPPESDWEPEIDWG